MYYATITSKDVSSNRYILIGQTQSGEILNEEQCRELLSLPVIKCEERHHIDQIKYGKLLENFADVGSLDDKISKEQIIQKYIEDKEGSFAYEVEKLKLLAGRKKTQLETDLNDIKTEIKDLKKQTGTSKIEELKITKQIKVLKKDLLQREEKLFYAKTQVDVETEQEIVDLTNKYNFNVLMSPHFKVQILGTLNQKTEEPIQEEIVLENPNMRYCIKPKINTLP